jgi:hypothetical protein
LLWTLLLAGCAAAVWWTVHVPYRPGAVFRAVPSDATAAGLHRDLWKRWPDLSANPIVKAVLAEQVPGAHPLREYVEGYAGKVFLKSVSSKALLWAQLPSYYGTGQASWMVSAWLGGRSQVFRWVLTWAAPDVLIREPLPTGGDSWRLAPGRLPGGLELHFAFLEGVFVGCVSSDELAFRRVVAAFDGRVASLSSETLCRGDYAGAPDLVWQRLPGGARPGSSMLCAVDRVGAGGLEGRVRMPGLELVEHPFSTCAALKPMRKLVGGRAMAFWATDVAGLAATLRGTAAPAWADLAGNLAADEREEVLVAALGGGYSGRYMDIRVPTLVFVLEAESEEDVHRRMGQALDRLNAAHQWGLIPRPVEAGALTLTGFQKAVDTEERSLSMGERPAYVVMDGALIISSNLDTLVRLVAEGGVPDGDAAPAWYDVVTRDAAACSWIDLERGATTLRAVIMIYLRNLLAAGPDSSPALQAQLRAAMKWISLAEPAKVCRVWLTGGTESPELEFSFGEERD